MCSMLFTTNCSCLCLGFLINYKKSRSLFHMCCIITSQPDSGCDFAGEWLRSSASPEWHGGSCHSINHSVQTVVNASVESCSLRTEQMTYHMGEALSKRNRLLVYRYCVHQWSSSGCEQFRDGCYSSTFQFNLGSMCDAWCYIQNSAIISQTSYRPLVSCWVSEQIQEPLIISQRTAKAISFLMRCSCSCSVCFTRHMFSHRFLVNKNNVIISYGCKRVCVCVSTFEGLLTYASI